MNSFQVEQLNKAKQKAIEKNGQCLSLNYVNVKVKLEWKCSDNQHKSWFASLDKILTKNQWCPYCSNRFSKEDMLVIAKNLAIKKKGKCLSTVFKTTSSKLEWKCSDNQHKSWFASLSTVKNNHWCPECAGFFSKEDGVKRAKELAISKSGDCLSNEYIKANKKLQWKCSENHIWSATYASVVLSGRWCPKCSHYYYKEHKYRDLLEYLLEENFKSTNPIWNINPKTNRPLELDGYNEKLKIAFEFQGKHHYEIGFYKNNKEDLNYIKYKDEIKKENCIKNNIKLIIIDDKFRLNQETEILDYLLYLLKEKNIKINKIINKDEIKLIFKKTIHHQNIYFKKAKEHAKNKGGDCLSTKYLSARELLEWKCSNEKHKSWLSSYDSVIRGSWCPECAGGYSVEDGLIKAKELAKLKKGQCLSNEYINARLKLKWQCEKGHIWEAKFYHVKDGHWCPKCVGRFSKQEQLLS